MNSPKNLNKPSKPKKETKTENLETPHLSAAYIRSLVKELSTSESQNPSPGDSNPDGDSEDSPPHRKPVRRRGQARKPYQEKLLNMAEARREIATALKLHRASMKQSRPGPEHHRFGPVSHHFSAEQEARLKSRRSPRVYASGYYSNNPNAHPPPGLYYSPHYYSQPVSSFPPPLLIQENPNFVLPSQTLGLNLNFQAFNDLDASFSYSTAISSSFYNSSPSTSCSPAPPPAEEISYMAEETRSVGDDMNFGVSARRAEFFESMGIGPDQEVVTEDLGVTTLFDEVMEFPAWMNADESCVHHVCADYFQDPALPCMDIEEIEEMDGDWLA